MILTSTTGGIGCKGGGGAAASLHRDLAFDVVYQVVVVVVLVGVTEPYPSPFEPIVSPNAVY